MRRGGEWFADCGAGRAWRQNPNKGGSGARTRSVEHSTITQSRTARRLRSAASGACSRFFLLQASPTASTASYTELALGLR